ncbi:hypothetical protein BS50DRAFT_568964 [Corynespora cassiicola Philippines]|uniref:Glyoxalase-like domain-containing protein n=1 Tax=Corynespora cassiicola Philippines TaxID=1448308 RepID=A0A2T2P6X8_CORCC|nr:hypothetical protein BS50DRAFT_568964 [Corynespora cassiicola Philippines]
MAHPQLDHLILFLPSDPATGLPAIPSFFQSNFTLTPGGTHADGLTSNTLILLADGVYIELISFINPDSASEAIQHHWWGPDAQRQGWADWCLTTPPSTSAEHNFAALKAKGLAYQEPRKGARKRADGVEVRWAVTFPEGADGGQAVRGQVPFWCHDDTPREVRVPGTAERVGHASGVLGVKRLSVVVRDQERLDEVRRTHQGLFGDENAVAVGDEVRFEVGRVKDVAGLERGATIVLRLPRNEAEAGKVKERGFWYGDVVLAAKKDGKEKGAVERVDGEAENDVDGIWVEYV